MRQKQEFVLFFAGAFLWIWGQAAEAIDDTCALLQVERLEMPKKLAHRVDERNTTVTATPNASGQCLKFMHIPKTGGTSIDSANMHQPSPVFDSFMLQTYQRVAASMPPGKFESDYDSNLGNLYDDSHRNTLHYVFWLAMHEDSYHMVTQPDGESCEDVHTTPGVDRGVTRFYAEPGCTVFCAVRDPFAKFISGYQHAMVGPCDPQGFEARVSSLFESLKSQPHQSQCFFTPQVEFVFGAKNTTQYCDSILHTENLNEEFDAFMRDNGQTLTLPEEHLFDESTHMPGSCEVDRTQVTQAAKDQIYEYFRADFEAFGYPRP